MGKMKTRLLILFCLLSVLCQTFAQTDDNKWFVFEKISNHVYAAIPNKSIRLISTSTIITGKHFIPHKVDIDDRPVMNRIFNF